MKLWILVLASTFGLSIAAHADGIVVTPVVPINCMQSALEDFSSVQVLPSTDPTSVTLQLVYGKCQLGNMPLSPIGDDYNYYLIGEEYSSDFQYNYSASGYDVVTQIKLNPAVFFAQYNVRHFELSFYPSAGPLNFNWNVVFSKDPTTGQVTLSLSPH